MNFPFLICLVSKRLIPISSCCVHFYPVLYHSDLVVAFRFFYIDTCNLSYSGTRATTGAASSPTSDWRKEIPEKITPLSQSSQTNAISKQFSPEQKEKTSSPGMCEVCGVEDAVVFVKVIIHKNFNL